MELYVPPNALLLILSNQSELRRKHMTKSTDIDPAEFQESLEDLSLKESLQAGLPHPGLPGPLPENEHVIWQGVPHWRNLARNLFHTRIVMAYFGIVMIAFMSFSILDGGDWKDACMAAIPVIFFAFITIGILSILSWIGAKATIYTVTNRRVVMRIGAAFSKSIDIPFKVIESVTLKSSSTGFGNISIKLKVGNSIPYFFIWPHARPWRFRDAEPMLRAVNDVEAVAKALVEQLEASQNMISEELREVSVKNRDLHVNTSTMTEDQVANSTSSVRPLFGRREGLIVKGAFVLAIAIFIVIFVAQRLDTSNKQFAVDSIKKIHQINVISIGSGEISLVDFESKKIIVVLATEGEGLIRNAIRGLERNRRQEKMPVDLPYQLIAWEGNRITLSDMELDRHIPLSSFGPLDSGALAILKKLVLPAGPAD